jgi:anti-sigma factor RsiW
MTPSTCPDAASLQALLDGALPEATQAELTRHLETCAACRSALDQLATDGRSFSGLARELQNDAAAPEPGLERVLSEAASTCGEETQAERRGNYDEELAFLAPSSRPGHLGRLGHYEIQELLGKGGFGIVLKAFDEKLHRVVAIKVLSPQVASSGTARKRFSREAQAAAAIAHEHVVTIHAVEDEHNPPYLVMQCIDGTSLQDKLDREGPLGLKEILRIGLQAAEGLAAAHKQGLVHRDIKPANILLENGVERVKITDFGLARAVDDASLTQSGVVAGTPLYMSPEQAEGLAIDHRSDLFSLGTVLYVMCTGRPPFRATGTMAVLKRVVEETPRAIREINPEVPDWLADIISKLHAKKPAERFQSAKEVAETLGTKLAELQMAGRVSAGTPAVAPPAVPRSRRKLVLALALLMLLVAGTAAVIGFWPRGAAETTDTRSNQGGGKPIDEPGRQPFVVLARDGRDDQTFPSLKDAVEKARSGDTIEIRGDGPFVTGPIDLGKKALAIQAGGGFKPHLKCQPIDPKSRAALLYTEAPLVLEGLILELASTPGQQGWQEVSIVYTDGAPFLASHCRLVGNKIMTALTMYRSPSAAVQYSEILGSKGYLFHGIVFSPLSSCRLSLENNVIFVQFHGIRFGQWSPDLDRAKIIARHNTMLESGPLTFDYGPSLEQLAAGGAKEPALALEITGSILTGNCFSFHPCDKSVSLEKAVALLPKLVSVRDQQNLYAGAGEHGFISANQERAPSPIRRLNSLAEWNKFWNIARPTSQVGTPVYQGGDVFAKTPDQLTPADFRLAPGSPGKGAGPGGKDVGADVDRVGPGKPYEDWKKTPEYAEWQKQVRTLLNGKP